MKILITGVAGFIGFHLARRLITLGYQIIGIDNLNNYYDIKLKKSRLALLIELGLKFHKVDISKKKSLDKFLKNSDFDIIIHLAAQAGVRYSIENPDVYIESNIFGFFNILEACRQNNIKHFIYASSSSVYGGNLDYPFDETQTTDKPQNLYAASKKSNEIMSFSYSQLYKIPSTGLRFFTVYGPWGRPDMAYFKFVKNIFNNMPIQIYGHGKMYRDFTYIDDVIEGIIKILQKGPPKIKTNNIYDQDDILNANLAPWEIFNIGNNKVVSIEEFINVIEKAIGIKVTRNYINKQMGDMYLTSANIDKIQSHVGYRPQTSINEGIPKFVKWFKNYYKIS